MPAGAVVRVRSLSADDHGWVVTTLEETWGSVHAARRGELVDASVLPGFVALVDDRAVGLAVVAVREQECEVVSISVSLPRRGVGRSLMQRCVEHARANRCPRLWLMTTNDNVAAFAFYQHVGLDLCALHRGAVAGGRRLKPSIPLTSADGLPLVHELEFELDVSPGR